MTAEQLAAQVAHRLTCTRCRMDWSCGGLGEADYEAGERIADFLTAQLDAARRQALLSAAGNSAMTGSWRPFGQWLKQRAARLYPVAPPAAENAAEPHDRKHEDSNDGRFRRVVCSCGWKGDWRPLAARTLQRLLHADNVRHTYAAKGGATE